MTGKCVYNDGAMLETRQTDINQSKGCFIHKTTAGTLNRAPLCNTKSQKCLKHANHTCWKCLLMSKNLAILDLNHPIILSFLSTLYQPVVCDSPRSISDLPALCRHCIAASQRCVPLRVSKKLRPHTTSWTDTTSISCSARLQIPNCPTNCPAQTQKVIVTGVVYSNGHRLLQLSVLWEKKMKKNKSAESNFWHFVSAFSQFPLAVQIAL